MCILANVKIYTHISLQKHTHTSILLFYDKKRNESDVWNKQKKIVKIMEENNPIKNQLINSNKVKCTKADAMVTWTQAQCVMRSLTRYFGLIEMSEFFLAHTQIVCIIQSTW